MSEAETTVLQEPDRPEPTVHRMPGRLTWRQVVILAVGGFVLALAILATVAVLMWQHEDRILQIRHEIMALCQGSLQKADCVQLISDNFARTG